MRPIQYTRSGFDYDERIPLSEWLDNLAPGDLFIQTIRQGKSIPDVVWQLVRAEPRRGSRPARLILEGTKSGQVHELQLPPARRLILTARGFAVWCENNWTLQARFLWDLPVAVRDADKEGTHYAY